MIAFFKRRWVLLSWVVILLACSVVNLSTVRYDSLFYTAFGLERGIFGYLRFDTGNWNPESARIFVEYRRPAFGKSPYFCEESGGSKKERLEIYVPLWLPLSVVLGWIVFREVRWREHRAKEAADSPAQS